MSSKFAVGTSFPKDELLEILSEDHPFAEVISDEIDGQSRWSVHHSLIFKYGELFYQVSYSTGATEHQDERPWEYEGAMIFCTQVVPVEVTTTQYQAVMTDIPEQTATGGPPEISGSHHSETY